MSAMNNTSMEMKHDDREIPWSDTILQDIQVIDPPQVYIFVPLPVHDKPKHRKDHSIGM